MCTATLDVRFEQVSPAVYTWVPLDLTGQLRLPDLPRGAVIAGREDGHPTYVARVRKDEHWELGKLNSWARFGFSWYGKEYEVACGEVLVAKGEHEPVWINGAHGEQVEGVVTSRAVEGKQSIGRAWHKGRWIPGKVVHFCYCLFFPFGGQELAVRNYQLISADFIWSASSQAPLHPVRVGDCTEEPENSAALAASVTCIGQDGASEMVLCNTTNDRETEWTVSGDGEYMRHSIAFPDGAQIGRAWIEKDGEAFWAQGNVRPQTQNMGPPGLITDGQLHHNYQILQARPKRTEPCLLSLTIGSNEIQYLRGGISDPPEELFMLTKLSSSERPWTAVRQMVEEAITRGNSRLSAGVIDHLQPMMSMVEQLAKAEVEGRDEVGLPGASDV